MAFQPQADYGGAGPQSSFPPPTSISSSMAERKGSIPVSSGGFVSPTHEWHEIPIEAKHVADGMNDLALGPGTSMDAAHFKNEQGWSPATQGYSQAGEFEPLISDYASNTNASGMGMQFDHSQTGPPSAGSMSAMPPMPNQGQFAISPQSQSWMTPVGEAFDFSPLAPQGNRQTPVFATSTNILRRDGIRKKNARFDIPAERNLRTIDHLIAQTADEGEIKELKQQKRLLRNRQAALDSRQRKKQHTERLEEEKKQFTNIITDLEEDAKQLEAQWLRRQEDWMQRQSQYQQWIQALQSEKEQTIQHYSNEVNELRRQNSMLMQQLQKDSGNLSVSGSSMPGEFNDFDQLTIQSSPWDNFSMQNEFSLEADHTSDHAMPATAKNINAMVKKDDKNSASGLLLMLLLCGAWVVSRGSTDTKEVLPAMPDELRAASATVIEDLYKGSGIRLPDADASKGTLASVMRLQESQRGSGSFDGAMNSYAINPMASPHAMGHPQAESFAPTASNVQSMGNILRDAMRSVQGQHTPTAETYTKSLLADKVPSQVLKDFAHMVNQNRQIKHEQQTVPQQLQQPNYD